MSESSNMIYPDGKPVGRYSAIGNDVLEKIADIELTRPERKVLDMIIRDTIGYPEKLKWAEEEVRRVTYEIPMEQFVEKTGLLEKKITPALDNLERRKIIKRDRDNIYFNYHLKEWL
jgi:phage replication O-like protein O